VLTGNLADPAVLPAFYTGVVGRGLEAKASGWVELFGLPSLIFGGGHRVNWPESVLETAIIALVAIPVLVLTRRLVLRLHYLEEFLRVCSWCRKLSAGKVEEFFERTFDTRTSHGCARPVWLSRRESCGGRAEQQAAAPSGSGYADALCGWCIVTARRTCSSVG
jgi:hypothetical protein